MRLPSLRPAEWPIAAKVPVLVAVMMVAVSAVITNQVLSRLADTQQRHFQELTASYLDGLSSSLIPAVLREDVWETFDILDRARTLYRGLKINQTVVVNGNRMVLASADPIGIPSYSRIPVTFTERFGRDRDLWLDENRELAGARRALVYQGMAIGAIYAEFDVAEIFQERSSVLWTLMTTNAAIALGLAALGYLSVRRILRPVRILTRHFLQGAVGEPAPVPDGQLGNEKSEFGPLFRRYNALVRAMAERKALTVRLAEEERLSSLGRLASGMAHEINNPLGGLFNAIDTLKRHGADLSARQRAISLLERGLSGIRDVVRSALVTYRIETSERPLRPADIDDLELLIRSEARRRELTLNWDNQLISEVPVRAGAVRQAVLNLLLNACAASPPKAQIWLIAKESSGALILIVRDQGPGLDADRIRYLQSGESATAPRPGEGGLGLWIVRRLLTEVGAQLTVEQPSEGGTVIKLVLPTAGTEDLRHVA